MSSFGLIPEGFNKKRLDDLVTALEGHFKDVYGVNFKVEPETKQGQIIANIANELSSLWDAAEDSYNAFNPSAALDKALSDLVQYNGLIRQPATQSQATLTLSGTVGAVIPSGSQVEVEGTGEKFYIISETTIPLGGSIDAAALSLNYGPVTGASGTINIIFTPITGWSTVTNVDDAVLGLVLESDEELRSRRNNSTAFNAQNIIESTAAQLLALDDVVHVLVLENDTDLDPDANGLPAHSGEAIVRGGADGDIASVLLRNNVPGIPWVGNSSITRLDSQGVPVALKVSRPSDIYLEVVVVLTTDVNYPANGDQLVKDNIINYAGGSLIAGRGFGVGDDVIRTELFTPINSVPGHSVDSLTIAIVGGTQGTANVPIDLRELSVFEDANITVVS